MTEKKTCGGSSEMPESDEASKQRYQRGKRDGCDGLNSSSISPDYMLGWRQGRLIWLEYSVHTRGLERLADTLSSYRDTLDLPEVDE